MFRRKNKERKLCIMMLILLLTLNAAGCSKSSQKDEKKGPDLEVSKIDVDLKLKEDESERLCYSDGKIMLFTVQVAGEHFTTTDRLVVYDMQNSEIEKVDQIDGKRYVEDAIPYKDGILYFAYDEAESAPDECTWTLTYLSDGEQKVIDRGTADHFASASMVSLDKDVYYAYTDLGADFTGAECGIRKIKNERPVSVTKTAEGRYWIFGSKEDAYYAALMPAGENEAVAVYEGTAKGVRELYKTGREESYRYALNNSHVLYTYGGEQNVNLAAIDLETGKRIVQDTELTDVVIVGIGDYFLLQDKSNNQYYARIGDTIELEKLEFSGESKYQVPLNAGMSIGKNRLILQTEAAEGEPAAYYLLTLK